MWQPQLLLIAGCALLALEADTTTIKWHSAGAAFDNPAAWLDDYLPCARDLVVFPQYYPAVLPLPASVAIGGFVLPRQGALLLAEDSTIELATGKGLSGACGRGDGRAYLKPPKTSKWFDPSSWSAVPTAAVSSRNSLTSVSIAPDLERVPCDDEHVVISSNSGPLSFDLEHVQYLRLGQLIMAGSSISRNYLQELLGRDLGQLLFHNAQAVTVEYYRGELCGCHKDSERLLEPVCHNVEPQCERPHCVQPVLPYGACCYVCGAIMSVPSEHCMAGDRKTLTAFIGQALVEAGLTDELLLHVDYAGSELHGQFLQAIVVDRGSYSERSVDFMRSLFAKRNQSRLLATSPKLKVYYAGRPYNPNVSFASVLLILFCVLLVGVVSTVVAAHFMPENPQLNRITRWIHDPRRWRWRHVGLRWPSNLLFNRFDNAAAGTGLGVGSGVERLAVIGYDAESEQVRERAFDNPMFEQEQAALADVATAETQPRLVSEQPIMAPRVETGELDSCSVEEQELTEINLESSDADSDAEAETNE